MINPACANQDGLIAVTGGNQPCQYSMDDGTTWQSCHTLGDLCPGTYGPFRIKDADGCEATAESITLTAPEFIELVSPDEPPVMAVTDPKARVAADEDGVIVIFFNGKEYRVKVPQHEKVSGTYYDIKVNNIIYTPLFIKCSETFAGYYRVDCPEGSGELSKKEDFEGVNCIGNLPLKHNGKDVYKDCWLDEVKDLSFTFSVHLQAFAPFDRFGFGFEGDGSDRKFGTKRVDKFRLATESKIRYSNNSFEFVSKNDLDTFSDWFGLMRQVSETISDVDFYNSGTPRKAHLQIISRAGNDATMLPIINDYLERNYGTDIGDITDMNIDRNLNLTFELEEITRETYILKIEGELEGEGFPATDLFIKDKNGNEITIGALPASVNMRYFPCSLGNISPQDCGPFAHLGKPIFLNFETAVLVKIKDGVFEKIIFAGREWKIEDWNQVYLERPTVRIDN